MNERDTNIEKTDAMEKALEKIGEIISLRGDPEHFEAWKKIEPFLKARIEEIPQQFLKLSKWSDSSKTLDLILHIIKILSGNLSVQEIAERVVNIVSEKLGFGIVLVSVLDPKQNVFVRMSGTGIPKEEFEQLAQTHLKADHYKKLMQEKFKISQSYLIRWWHEEKESTDNSSYTPPDEKSGEWNPKDMLLVPMNDNSGSLIGVISVDNPPGGTVPDRSLLMSLEILAARAGQAILESWMYEKTQQNYHNGNNNQKNNKILLFLPLSCRFAFHNIIPIKTPMTIAMTKLIPFLIRANFFPSSLISSGNVTIPIIVKVVMNTATEEIAAPP